jgi:hypothetical protein
MYSINELIHKERELTKALEAAKTLSEKSAIYYELLNISELLNQTNNY